MVTCKVKSKRDLGVIVQSNLKMDVQCSNVCICADSTISARTLQATTSSSSSMHLQAIDICSMHAKREDTSEHPVDLSALKFKIKVPN